MLSPRQQNTLLAALLFWQEEITPHDRRIARPYLPDPRLEPLSNDEIEQLRGQLQAVEIRYALYDPAADRLAGLDLFTITQAARQNTLPRLQVVSVLIASRPSA